MSVISKIIGKEIEISELCKTINLSDFSLAKAKILYFLQTYETLSATQLARICNLHAPSLSRILPDLARSGYLKREPGEDGRVVFLSLTAKGKKKFSEVFEQC